MTSRAPHPTRHASVSRSLIPALANGVAVIAIAVVLSAGRPVHAATPARGVETTVYFPAKLKVLRASVQDGTLGALFSITGRATGTITVDYQAAGRFQRTFVELGERREGEKRIAVQQPLAGAQRAIQTGIINAAFAGDDATQSDSTRLRAAKARSDLRVEQVMFAAGRLSVAGSIDEHVSGAVRLRASYLDSDGSIGVWAGRAAIMGGVRPGRGIWALDEKLPAPASTDANAYLTMQFTGQKDAPGGPYRGEQIGKSLGNLAGFGISPPVGDGDLPPDIQSGCGGADQDVCAERDVEHATNMGSARGGPTSPRGPSHTKRR